MNEITKGDKMKLGVLWHGDSTITVHNVDCKDYRNPDKKRSSGLESGLIADCVAELDMKIHKVCSDHEKLYNFFYDWLPSSMLSNTKLEYMNCCK